MKHCTYCGKEYPDEIENCPTDGTLLRRVGKQIADPPVLGIQKRDTLSAEERYFWERMTFRQFAILMVRLQALWLLFNAVIDATYLPRYFARPRGLLSSSPLYTQISLDALLAIIRIVLHVAAALALIQYAERVISWLVKDSIPKQTSKSVQSTETPP